MGREANSSRQRARHSDGTRAARRAARSARGPAPERYEGGADEISATADRFCWARRHGRHGLRHQRSSL